MSKICHWVSAGQVEVALTTGSPRGVESSVLGTYHKPSILQTSGAFVLGLEIPGPPLQLEALSSQYLCLQGFGKT